MTVLEFAKRIAALEIDVNIRHVGKGTWQVEFKRERDNVHTKTRGKPLWAAIETALIAAECDAEPQ